MNAYTLALYLHIVGGMGFFVALSLEWTGLRQLRDTKTSDQAGAWLRILRSTRTIGITSMSTATITGIYMMVTTWGHVAWISVALGALVLVVALAMWLTGPRMAAVGRALVKEKGQLSNNFHAQVNNPLLWISIQMRVTITLGIVFLMTVKPGLAGSVLAIIVTIVLGLVIALPMPNRERVQEGQAD